MILDEPTEGIQPSIIKEIERVIRALAERGDVAILLIEQYFEFARDLAASYLVMQRGVRSFFPAAAKKWTKPRRSYLTV